MGTWEEHVWHGQACRPTINYLDLMLHPKQGVARDTRATEVLYGGAAETTVPAVRMEYGGNIMRALKPSVVAARMEPPAGPPTHAAGGVDLFLLLTADVSGTPLGLTNKRWVTRPPLRFCR